MAETTIGARTLAEQVAGELGDGWSVAPLDGHRPEVKVWLVGPERARLMFGESADYAHRGRLQVAGWSPEEWTAALRDSYTGDLPDNPVIRLSWDRGAQAIAREITRRLLPGHLEWLAAAAVTVERHDDAGRRKAETVAVLRRLLGDSAITRDRAYLGNGITLDVQGAGSVAVSGYVRAEHVEAVVGLLRGLDG